MRIGMMGLGEIGSNNKKYLESLGHTVIGYDPRFNSTFDMSHCDVYMICADSDHVIEACEQIETIDKTPILLIESTVKTGTCRQIYTDVFRGKANVIYCPQRFWAKDPEGRGVRRFRLISAFYDVDIGKGVVLYRDIFDIPVYPVFPVEVAEFAKVAENAYRGVQIAYAQELKMEADRLGLDFNIIREAIMTASPMHYLPIAMEGIGGHCLQMAMEWLEPQMSLVRKAIVSDMDYKNYIKK